MSEAQENPYAAPETELSPGETWIASGSPGLAKTAKGLSTVYYGIVFILLGAICGPLLFFVAPPAAILAGGLFFLGWAMLIIGPLLCLSVPAETGAKGLIVASVICQLANLVLSLGHTVLGMTGGEAMMTDDAQAIVVENGGNASVIVVQLIAGALSILYITLFVLFMKKLAEFVGREDLSRRARNVLILFAITFVFGILIGVASTGVMPQVAAFVMLPMGILALVGFVMYANLINALRKVIRPPTA